MALKKNTVFLQYFYRVPYKIYFILMTTVAPQKEAQKFTKRCLQSDNKCVCQICTCHKHHCPPKHVPFNADTTNHEFYKTHNVSVERARKCGYQLSKSRYDPEVLRSTYRVDYKQKNGEPARYQSKYGYQPNTAKFYDETEYKKSYVPNQIEVQKPTPCGAQFRPSSARFEASTTYKSTFQGKKGEQGQLKKHYAYQANSAPFDEHTTYGDYYKKYDIECERPRGCCNGGYTSSAGKFDGHTSYHDFYKGKQNPQHRRCLIEELPVRPRQCSPGKDHIHFCAHECSWK